MIEPTEDMDNNEDLKGAIDLGHNHTLKFSSYEGDPYAGATVSHLKPDGSRCMDWITIRGSTWHKSFKESIAAWDLVSKDPVTLTPSLACRVCGDHGFVTDGKWVPA